MDCPTLETLANLLIHDTGPSAPGQSNDVIELWLHLESCHACCKTLDQLSDDTELQRWRDSRPSAKDPLTDSKVCDALVQRIVKGDTSQIFSEDTGREGTRGEWSNDRVFPLETSDVPGDLGRIGIYRIVRSIGQGGMAVVFEAIDTELDRKVAVKLLRSEYQDLESRERFQREARALAGIRHPNVVSVYSVAVDSTSNPFIVMEYVQGESIQDRLKREEVVSPNLAAQWIADVADGLAAAHEAGLVHRDIKPSNVLLAPDLRGYPLLTAKLADFGLARSTSVAQQVTQTGVLLGTPAYMSPEHIAAPELCNAKSDIYSLGVTLYELLTGQVPFRGPIHTVLQRIGRDDPESAQSINANVPKDLETICMKAMHREPSKRYATSKDFSEDLRRWLRHEPIMARPASLLEKVSSWCRRNRRVAILAATVVGLLLMVTSISTYAAFSLQLADQTLRQEKKKVEVTSQQLAVTAEEAMTQRAIAISSLEGLVNKVQAELLSRPGTLPLRASILETALDGLDKIASSIGNPDSMLLKIRAHTRRGEILDSLGRTNETVQEYDIAEKLAMDIFAMQSENLDIKQELANVLLAKADLIYKRGGMAQSMSLYERVLELRESTLNETPDRMQARQDVAVVLQRMADVRLNEFAWDAAQPLYARSLSIFQDSFDQSTEDKALHRSLCIAQQRMGTIESLRGNSELATAYLESAIVGNEQLLSKDPTNKVYRGDLAAIAGALARLYTAKGEHAKAIDQAQNAIGYATAVSELDPQDTDARMKVSGAWLVKKDAHFWAGDFVAAEEATNKIVEITLALCEANPTSTKYPMYCADTLNNLVQLQMRMGKLREAGSTVSNLISLLRRCQRTADAKPEEFQQAIELQENVQKGIELALSDLNLLDEINQHESSDSLYIARVVRMYESARLGQTELALNLGERLAEEKPKSDLIANSCNVLEARAYAMCYSHASRSESEESLKRKEKSLQGCLLRLKSTLSNELLKSNKTAAMVLMKDQDFHDLQTHPDFLALLQN